MKAERLTLKIRRHITSRTKATSPPEGVRQARRGSAVSLGSRQRLSLTVVASCAVVGEDVR